MVAWGTSLSITYLPQITWLPPSSNNIIKCPILETEMRYPKADKKDRWRTQSDMFIIHIFFKHNLGIYSFMTNTVLN